MSISSIGNSILSSIQASTASQAVRVKQDSDGDNDGSKAGQAESASEQPKVSSISLAGSVINTIA